MALIDDITEEIKKAHAKEPKEPELSEKKPEKKRQKTKEEVAAYIARKQAEEERRYLKQREANESASDHKPAKKKDCRPNAEKPAKEEKPRQPRQKASCSKARPKTIKTIDLPDGGSLLIIYMPGPS